MKSPRTVSEKFVFATVGLLIAALSTRGMHAIITGVYESSPKYGSPIRTEGVGATLAGITYLSFAGIVSAGIYYQYTPNKRRGRVVAALALGLSLVSITVSVAY